MYKRQGRNGGFSVKTAAVGRHGLYISAGRIGHHGGGLFGIPLQRLRGKDGALGNGAGKAVKLLAQPSGVGKSRQGEACLLYTS